MDTCIICGHECERQTYVLTVPILEQDMAEDGATEYIDTLGLDCICNKCLHDLAGTITNKITSMKLSAQNLNWLKSALEATRR